MADSTLALNPVTPLYAGAPVSATNALPVFQAAITGQGWLYVNYVGATGGTGSTNIVKASAATFHGITVNAISTLGTWSVIDAAATAATPIVAAGSLGTVTSLYYDANTTAGLLFVTVTTSTATSLPNITLLYK
jgi:hypothetical protein